MTVLNAHFDGKVFVPQALPTDLLPGNVTLQVSETGLDLHPLSGLAVIRVQAGAKVITSDDVRRFLDEDE